MSTRSRKHSNARGDLWPLFDSRKLTSQTLHLKNYFDQSSSIFAGTSRATSSSIHRNRRRSHSRRHHELINPQEQCWLLAPHKHTTKEDSEDFKLIQELLYSSFIDDTKASSLSSPNSSCNEIEHLDENVFFENDSRPTTTWRQTQNQLRRLRARARAATREEAIAAATHSSSSSDDAVDDLIAEIDRDLRKSSSHSLPLPHCGNRLLCECRCHAHSPKSSNPSNSWSSSSVCSGKNARFSTSASASPSRRLINMQKRRRHFGSFESLDWDVSFDLKNKSGAFNKDEALLSNGNHSGEMSKNG